jgi:hypothetical protein
MNLGEAVVAYLHLEREFARLHVVPNEDFEIYAKAKGEIKRHALFVIANEKGEIRDLEEKLAQWRANQKNQTAEEAGKCTL